LVIAFSIRYSRIAYSSDVRQLVAGQSLLQGVRYFFPARRGAHGTIIPVFGSTTITSTQGVARSGRNSVGGKEPKAGNMGGSRDPHIIVIVLDWQTVRSRMRVKLRPRSRRGRSIHEQGLGRYRHIARWLRADCLSCGKLRCRPSDVHLAGP